MQLTRETDYAVRTVLYLAKIGESASANEISDVLKIPKRFARVVLVNLLRSGIVRSHRGKFGGYAFAKLDASLLDVVLAVEGKIEINKCLCEASGCERIEKSKCVVHHALTDLNELIKSELEKLKVSDIAPSFLLE